MYYFVTRRFFMVSKTHTGRVQDGFLKLAQNNSATNPYTTKNAETNLSFIDKNIKLVDDYLKKLDWQVKENSNMTYSIQGYLHAGNKTRPRKR